MKKIFAVIILLWSQQTFGQNFKYGTNVPAVDSSGFYKIQLTPQINSKLRSGFPDIRLFDDLNKEVPCILRDDKALNNSAEFKEYEIADKTFLKDSLSRIIIKNTRKESISNISLLIRNAEVHKELKLSGSDDGKQWFVVKEYASISSISNEKETAELKLLDFPLTNYTYYKIEINDKNSAPLDIVKAGYYDIITTKGAYTGVKTSMTVSDSTKQKRTWVHVKFEERNYIDEFEFKIVGPKYFLRKAYLYTGRDDKSGNVNKESSDRFLLDSKSPLLFPTALFTNEVWFEIINEDDAPLKISGIKCLQLNHYLVAGLEKGKQYELHFSDSLASAPSYDLKYFPSVIPPDMKVLIPGTISLLTSPAKAEIAPKNIFADKRFIWIVLIVVISLLGFVTYRMMTDAK
jgi:hypothetical protein